MLKLVLHPRCKIGSNQRIKEIPALMAGIFLISLALEDLTSCTNLGLAQAMQ
jgi:hypothetical protein